MIHEDYSACYGNLVFLLKECLAAEFSSHEIRFNISVRVMQTMGLISQIVSSCNAKLRTFHARGTKRSPCHASTAYVLDQIWQHSLIIMYV